MILKALALPKQYLWRGHNNVNTWFSAFKLKPSTKHRKHRAIEQIQCYQAWQNIYTHTYIYIYTHTHAHIYIMEGWKESKDTIYSWWNNKTRWEG